jgi:hypothetical protein
MSAVYVRFFDPILNPTALRKTELKKYTIFG